jgi:hypothetical protein
VLSEIGARRLIGKVCRERGVEPPPVEFGDADCAGYHRVTNLILLPTPSWAKDNKAELAGEAGTAAGYRLVILHEVTHFLYGPRHDAGFYAYLFSLCLRWGVPLSVAIRDEMIYKPRAAARGIDKLAASFIEGETPDKDSQRPVDDPHRVRHLWRRVL